MNPGSLKERMDAAPESGAWMSEDGLYRWALWRTWDSALPLLIVQGLNPSTADHENDDPTIRKIIKFAKQEGYGGIIMLNSYAYRSTDPMALKRVRDAFGWPTNNHAFRQAAELANNALCCYGTMSGNMGSAMAQYLLRFGVKLWTLGLTKDGHPVHPLYQRDSTRFIPFMPDREKLCRSAGRSSSRHV